MLAYLVKLVWSETLTAYFAIKIYYYRCYTIYFAICFLYTTLNIYKTYILKLVYWKNIYFRFLFLFKWFFKLVLNNFLTYFSKNINPNNIFYIKAKK